MSSCSYFHGGRFGAAPPPPWSQVWGLWLESSQPCPNFFFGHQITQSTPLILLTKNIGLWQVWLYGQLISLGIRVNRRVLCWDLGPRSFIKPSGEFWGIATCRMSSSPPSSWARRRKRGTNVRQIICTIQI